MTTQTIATGAVTHLLGWYAANAEKLSVLADEREVPLETLLSDVLDDAMARNGMDLVPEVDDGLLRAQDLVLNPESYYMWQGGRSVHLPRLQFEVLAAMMRRTGNVITRRTLTQEVWLAEPAFVGKTVDMHVAWIRKNLRDEKDESGFYRYINTVRGVGWRFELQPHGHADLQG
jgi:DNA-binding response OmpR family regulator